MRRRDVLRWGLAAGAAALTRPAPGDAATARARVVLVKAEDRRDGVRRALTLLGTGGLAGRHVVVKPNFNSADPFPGSTHPETTARRRRSRGGRSSPRSSSPGPPRSGSASTGPRRSTSSPTTRRVRR